jgi:hypothetical protein
MKKFIMTLAVLCISLLSAGILECYAKTWYVRPRGSSGNLLSPWDGSSKEHAFHGLTGITWGSGGVSAGDTLVLCRGTGDPGEFPRTLSIGASGTSGNPIVIQSENAASPETIISEKQINWPGISGYDSTKTKTAGNYALGAPSNTEYVNISNIKVKNCGGIKFPNCFFVTLQNMKIENVYGGVLFEGGGNNLVENCDINNVVGYGIGLFGTNLATTTPINNTIIRNNKCGNSLDGDGITLHRSNDGNYYDIGGNNQVIGNISYDNQEEGLDITSGNPILIEGNETYNNGGRGAVIYHGAQNVTFIRNYSHNEGGLLMGQADGNVTVAYNIFDPGAHSGIIVTAGGNYKVYNNIFRSSGTAIKPATIDIREGAQRLDFQNNIVIATQTNGYLLRIASGTPASREAKFGHNCWWQPSGAQATAFYDAEKGSHAFSAFKAYSSVTDTLFVDALLNSDFTVTNSSPCIDAGTVISNESYIAKDYKGATAPNGTRDIGAIEGNKSAGLTAPKNLRVGTGN